MASLCVMCKMARLVDNEERYEYYRDILDRGSAAYDKLLWNGKLKHPFIGLNMYMVKVHLCLRLKMYFLSCLGKYYNYDSSGRDHSTSVMSDQCAGHWFLRASGLGEAEYQAS